MIGNLYLKAVLVAGVWLAATASLAGVAGSRPNIILILADDMGYADLGCYGGPFDTPNIDRLAQEGMRFTDAYAACPVCSPTRASILTGKYPARLRLTDWLNGHKRVWEKLALPKWKKGLDSSETTIGELLKQKGYACAAPGKWHVGKANALEQGFDMGEEDWNLNKKEDEQDPKGVFTLTRQVLDFVGEQTEQPFFVYLSHFSVHTPVRYNTEVKRKYEKWFEKEGLSFNAGYGAMVEAFDDSVGMLVDGLEKLDLLDDTLLLFYSDNGGLNPYTKNDPLREGKGTLYEGGVRVPLIARWPGRIAPATENAEVVTSVDLLPTFCELAGVDVLPKDIDGVSFLNVMTEQASLNRDAVFWHYPHYHKGQPGSVIRKGDYKLIEFLEDGTLELYNLKSDIGESKNLAKAMPEKTAELLVELNEWRSSVNAQMMEKNSNYDPKKIGKTAGK